MTTASARPMSAETQALLNRPNFAHLATISADGSPKLDPMWIEVIDDTTITMTTSRTSPKTQNILRDPRVGLSVVDMDDPYEEVQLRGIASVEPDVDMVAKDSMSHKYTGAPFFARDVTANRVILRVTITYSRYTQMPLKHTPPAGG